MCGSGLRIQKRRTRWPFSSYPILHNGNQQFAIGQQGGALIGLEDLLCCTGPIVKKKGLGQI